MWNISTGKKIRILLVLWKKADQVRMKLIQSFISGVTSFCRPTDRWNAEICHGLVTFNGERKTNVPDCNTWSIVPSTLSTGLFKNIPATTNTLSIKENLENSVIDRCRWWSRRRFLVVGRRWSTLTHHQRFRFLFTKLKKQREKKRYPIWNFRVFARIGVFGVFAYWRFCVSFSPIRIFVYSYICVYSCIRVLVYSCFRVFQFTIGNFYVCKWHRSYWSILLALRHVETKRNRFWYWVEGFVILWYAIVILTIFHIGFLLFLFTIYGVWAWRMSIEYEYGVWVWRVLSMDQFLNAYLFHYIYTLYWNCIIVKHEFTIWSNGAQLHIETIKFTLPFSIFDL